MDKMCISLAQRLKSTHNAFNDILAKQKRDQDIIGSLNEIISIGFLSNAFIEHMKKWKRQRKGGIQCVLYILESLLISNSDKKQLSKQKNWLLKWLTFLSLDLDLKVSQHFYSLWQIHILECQEDFGEDILLFFQDSKFVINLFSGISEMDDILWQYLITFINTLVKHRKIEDAQQNLNILIYLCKNKIYFSILERNYHQIEKISSQISLLIAEAQSSNKMSEKSFQQFKYHNRPEFNNEQLLYRLICLYSIQKPFFSYISIQKFFKKQFVDFQSIENAKDSQQFSFKFNYFQKEADLKQRVFSFDVIQSNEQNKCVPTNKKIEELHEEQKSQFEYVVYDSIVKVCGIIGQQYFLMLKLQQKYSTDFLKGLEKVVFIQIVDSIEEMKKNMERKLIQQQNASFFVIDIENSLSQNEMNDLSNNKTVKLIYRLKSNGCAQTKIEEITILQLEERLTKVKKIGNYKQKINYNVITGKEKSLVNKYRLGYAWMLNLKGQENIQAAKLNALRFVKEHFLWKNEENFLQPEYEYMDFFQFQKIMSDLDQNQSSLVLLNLYTQENFFHKLINTSLRSLDNCMQTAYLRYFVLKLYSMIRALYLQQAQQLSPIRQYQNEQGKIICFRGCYLTQKQLEELKKFEGEYIELEGFSSSSIVKQQSQNFGNGTFIIIEIPQQIIENKIKSGCPGFALLQKYSQHKKQKQVVFNPTNVFRILSVDAYSAKLQFCDIDTMNGCSAAAEDDIFKANQLHRYNKYIKQVSIKNQGDVLSLCGAHKQAEDYYNKMFLINSKFRHSLQLNKIKSNNSAVYEKIKTVVQNFVKMLSSGFQSRYKQFIEQEFVVNLVEGSAIQELLFQIIYLQVQQYTGIFHLIGSRMVDIKAITKQFAESYLLISLEILNYIFEINKDSKYFQSEFSLKRLQALLSLGRYYYHNGQYDEAKKMLENSNCKSYLESETGKNTILSARILNMIGLVARMNYQIQVLIDTLERCYAIYEHNGEQQKLEAINIRCTLAYVKIQQYLDIDQLKQIKRCLFYFQNLSGCRCPEYAFTQSLYLRACFLLQNKKQFQMSQEYIAQYIRQTMVGSSNLTHNQWGLLNTYVGLLTDSKQYHKVEQILNPFVGLIEEQVANTYYHYSQMLAILSYVKFFLGNSDQFENLKQKVLMTEGKAPLPVKQVIYDTFGMTAYQNKQYAEAIVYFTKQKQIMDADQVPEDSTNQLRVQNYILLSKLHTKQFSEADVQKIYCLIAIIQKQIQDGLIKCSYYICDHYASFAEAKILLGLNNEALSYLAKAQKLLVQKNLTQTPSFADIWYLKALALLNEGNLQQAEFKINICKKIRDKNYGQNTQKCKQVTKIIEQISERKMKALVK